MIWQKIRKALSYRAPSSQLLSEPESERQWKIYMDEEHPERSGPY